MKKNILLAAAVALCATGIQAQNDVLYLIKGNEVVSKYRVSDVDYATFHLPEGVVDPTPDFPVEEQVQYVGATGSYYGTKDNMADFQIIFSTRPIQDENTPVELMYLQFTTPAVDYHDIKIAPGTYTLGSTDSRSEFTFFPGVQQGENIGGTVLVHRPDDATTTATVVTGGSFTVEANGSTYTIKGEFMTADGQLNFSYKGYIHIDNNSDEQDPAEELPLPESKLTEDVNVTGNEVYATVYNGLLGDHPNLRYIYVMIYTDNTYANCLDLGLIVNTEKYPDVILPKGKYPIVKRTDSVLNATELGAFPAFQIVGDTSIADYGCWYTQDYTKNPLVEGEVEVLEDATTLRSISLKATLKDNAATPHTVTCEYTGPCEEI